MPGLLLRARLLLLAATLLVALGPLLTLLLRALLLAAAVIPLGLVLLRALLLLLRVPVLGFVEGAALTVLSATTSTATGRTMFGERDRLFSSLLSPCRVSPRSRAACEERPPARDRASRT